MSKGWVKLHRVLLRSELWKKPQDLRLFIWILLNVDAKTGQMTAGLRRIAKGFAEEGGDVLHPTKIQRMLKRLERRGSVTITQLGATLPVTERVTQSVTHLTVINWHLYQQKLPSSVTKSVTLPVTERVTYTRSKEVLLEPSQRHVPDKRVKDILGAYAAKIRSTSKPTRNAKDKITHRLKTFSEDDLLAAIDNFSSNEWWMTNNGHRGIAWFFRSDDRIDQFLNLTSETKTVSLDVLQQSIEAKRQKTDQLGLT